MAVQRDVDVLNSRFKTQEIVDRYRYDTVLITPGASRAQFFQSLTSSTGLKSKAEADFEGDKALVKEGRLYEVRFVVAQIVRLETVAQTIDKNEMEAFFDKGAFVWDVANVRFDGDTLRTIAGGIQVISRDEGPLAVPQIAGYWGDARHDNVRMYSIPKVVPGGREVDFEVQWPLTGGAPNTSPVYLQIKMYGIELVPLQEVDRI